MYLSIPQLRSLIHVRKVKKLTFIRFIHQDGTLCVGWQAKGGGMMYRWIGQHGKFVR